MHLAWASVIAFLVVLVAVVATVIDSEGALDAPIGRRDLVVMCVDVVQLLLSRRRRRRRDSGAAVLPVADIERAQRKGLGGFEADIFTLGHIK
jgi:hypothetical protein